MDAQPKFKLNTYSKDNFISNGCSKEYMNFGLKGDKFVKFMVELCAEFNVKANSDAKVKLHNDIINYNLIRPINSVMFLTDYNGDIHIPSAQETTSNLNDKLFKIETGEVCMLLNKQYRNKYYPTDNNVLVNRVAKTLNKLVCLNATYDFLNNKIRTIDVTKKKTYLRDHIVDYILVTIDRSIYKFKIDLTKPKVTEAIKRNPTQNNFTGRDCDCFMSVEGYNTLRYVTPNDKDYPYKKIIKEEAEKYWNPQSTKPFFHTSFTCRDVYLIFLLLTGASKKTILKNYSKDEIAEMVGTDKDVLDQEICKAAYDELDTFTKKFHEEAKYEIDRIEEEFKRKLIEVKKARIADLVAKLNTLNDEYMDKIKELTPNIDGFSYPNKFMTVYGMHLNQLKNLKFKLDYDLSY